MLCMDVNGHFFTAENKENLIDIKYWLVSYYCIIVDMTIRVSQNFPDGTQKIFSHVLEVWGYSRKENSKRPTTFGETLCCPCDPNFTKEI